MDTDDIVILAKASSFYIAFNLKLRKLKDIYILPIVLYSTLKKFLLKMPHFFKEEEVHLKA